MEEVSKAIKEKEYLQRKTNELIQAMSNGGGSSGKH